MCNLFREGLEDDFRLLEAFAPLDHLGGNLVVPAEDLAQAEEQVLLLLLPGRAGG